MSHPTGSFQPDETGNTVPSTKSRTPAVVADALTVTRGQTQILRGLDATIPAGSCCAILGRNGCGKTSFTRAILGQLMITSGTMTVLGQTLGKTDVRRLRQRIGVVNPTTDSGFSHTSGAVVDSDLTAHEAVLTGFFGTVWLYDTPSDWQRHRATQLLGKVGLEDRAGHRFSLLSTGEQRRCLIARALTVGGGDGDEADSDSPPRDWPELLILDEPTAGLDLRGREQVLATVENILTQPDPPTVLMITHHVEELSPRTEKVFLMRDGQFIDEGSPDEVIHPESLSDTFGCQVFVQRRNGRFWLEVLPEAWLEFGE